MSRRARIRPSLDEVSEHFATWRKTRKCLGPIPDQLWNEAIELISEFPISRVAKTLHLCSADLRKRCSPLAHPDELDIPFLKIQGSVVAEALNPTFAPAVLDFQRPDGFRLRIESANQSELVVLLDRFLEAGSCCN